MNIVEFENRIDRFEEEQELLRQMALEESFQVGDLVVFTNENMQAFFGKGIHTVENVTSVLVVVRLWHDKRSINVKLEDIAHVSPEEFSMATTFVK